MKIYFSCLIFGVPYTILEHNHTVLYISSYSYLTGGQYSIV